MQSVTLIQRAWRREYPKSAIPSSSTIKNIVSNFEKTGSVDHVPPKPKVPSPKREGAKNQLKSLISEFPKLSIAKCASAVGISATLTYHIVHDDLHLKPYKFHKWHKLEDADCPKRVIFANWYLDLPLTHQQHMFFSDEAYFYLTLPINKQNNREWAASNPCNGVEKPLHDKKVLVWCAISPAKIIGPYYFTECVNQRNYLKMLKDYFIPRLLKMPSREKYYFQQDGATPHTATSVQTWLSDKFGEKFIDKKSWPPRSPDLNPCDFYLWGHLKSKVYNPLPKTLDDLRENIGREIKNIPSEVLKSTFVNLKKRCDLIKSVDGGHIE